MTVWNDPINVIVHPVSGECECNGLTKREYFAAMRKEPIFGEETMAQSWAELIMDSKVPEGPSILNIKWWIAAHEKFAVMRVDALIEALNK